MNETSHLPSKLPSMEQNFLLDKKGKITGHRWVGDFICKIPNTKEKCLIGKHRAFLNGQYAEFLDLGTLRIHEKIAYLRFTLVDYPKFWKDADLGYEMLDHNIIEEVYKVVLKFEDTWLKEVWGDEDDEDERTNAEGLGDKDKTATEAGSRKN